MKLLTKIRLIHWHYFDDHLLELTNSALFTGENASGKSTILDALQLVLTTNTRKFNAAANEKSNRDLRGYVRCKIGSESKTYQRQGNIISFVALEFFDDKKKTEFVIGAKLDSPDEESRIDVKFFIEECSLDDLVFIKDKRVVTDKEFIRNGKKIELIGQQKNARERIQRRLGNLDNKFFELIPKSLAFKPMDNVKDFINKYMLEENNVDVERLREGIENLKKFETLMKETEDKIIALEEIVRTNDEITKIEKEAKSIEILILKAKLEYEKEKISSQRRQLDKYEHELKDLQKAFEEQSKISKTESDRISALKNNDAFRLIENIERTIGELNKEKSTIERSYDRLKSETQKLEGLAAYLDNEGITQKKIRGLLKTESSKEQNFDFYSLLNESYIAAKGRYSRLSFKAEDELKVLLGKRTIILENIQRLQKKQFTYPIPSIQKLKDEIEKEFGRHGIKSKVYILCELLEIADAEWKNAVEGYLNNQRFSILVEPKYFDIAFEVYLKHRNEVHTVGLINVAEIDLKKTVDPTSLAYVVKSNDRYAQGYINYLLAGVVRCANPKELKKHRMAVTKDGVYYKNFVVRKIDPETWATPFIGATAYEEQLRIAKKGLSDINDKIAVLQKEQREADLILQKFSDCKIDLIKEDLYAPHALLENAKRISSEEKALADAQKNPDILSKLEELKACEKRYDRAEQQKTEILMNQGSHKKAISDLHIDIKREDSYFTELQSQYDDLNEKFVEAAQIAEDKLKLHLKTKGYGEVSANFGPRLQTLKNQKDEAEKKLQKQQLEFDSKFSYDFAIGLEFIKEYFDEKFKLENSKITEFKEELQKAKERCEKEFRDSFLSEMRENIETAKQEFKELNAVLKDVCYGGEYYKFEITPNKVKEQLHRMITDEFNYGSNTIFGSEFEKKYKDEIEDLFSKLTVYDDSGEKTLREYSDYRNYLDYDIEVTKNGEKHKFSKIYAEKSGGETQTPYYVAIAASFHQIYDNDDTIRLIMLDEAFDKMDDGRIDAMMKFFKSLGFQIIMATPPAKMEVIGEIIETVLLVQRINNCSIVSKYEMGVDV